MVLLYLCIYFQGTGLSCIYPTSGHTYLFPCYDVSKYVTFHLFDSRTSTELLVGALFFLQDICPMLDCSKYDQYTPYILAAGTHSNVLASTLRFHQIAIDST